MPNCRLLLSSSSTLSVFVSEEDDDDELVDIEVAREGLPGSVSLERSLICMVDASSVLLLLLLLLFSVAFCWAGGC